MSEIHLNLIISDSWNKKQNCNFLHGVILNSWTFWTPTPIADNNGCGMPSNLQSTWLKKSLLKDIEFEDVETKDGGKQRCKPYVEKLKRRHENAPPLLTQDHHRRCFLRRSRSPWDVCCFTGVKLFHHFSEFLKYDFIIVHHTLRIYHGLSCSTGRKMLWSHAPCLSDPSPKWDKNSAINKVRKNISLSLSGNSYCSLRTNVFVFLLPPFCRH